MEVFREARQLSSGGDNHDDWDDDDDNGDDNGDDGDDSDKDGVPKCATEYMTIMIVMTMLINDG